MINKLLITMEGGGQCLVPSRLFKLPLCFAKQTQGSPYEATFREKNDKNPIESLSNTGYTMMVYNVDRSSSADEYWPQQDPVPDPQQGGARHGRRCEDGWNGEV